MSRPKGFKHTEETKQRLREVMLAKWNDPEWVANRKGQIGERRPRTEEEKAAMSDKMTDKWQDKEFRQRITKKQSEGAKARWADPVKREKFLKQRAEALARRQQNND